MTSANANLWVFQNLGELDEKNTIKRLRGCQFIKYLTLKYRYPSIIISCASILFHRYCIRTEIHYLFDVAAACFMIAIKLRDYAFNLNDLARTCAKACIDTRNSIPKPSNPEKIVEDWETSLLYHEEMVLAKLCYDLEVECPWDIFSKFKSQIEDSQVLEMSKTIISDRYNTKDIIAACIYTACQNTEKEFDKKLQSSSKMDRIKEINQRLVKLYKFFQE